MEPINAQKLLEATRETKCQYIIMPVGRSVDSDLTELGIEFIDIVDGYIIYEDPEVARDRS